MVNYGEAIKRPFTDFGKLVIGVLLYILPIVNLFVVGYSLECAKSASKKKYELPAWTGFGNLFVQGLLACVISCLYALPGLILLVVGALAVVKTLLFSSQGSVTGMLAPGISQVISAIATGGPILLIAVLLLLISVYISPIAVIGYAINNKFAKAFDIGSVFRKAFTGKYFVSWLVVLVYAFIVAGVLSLIPLVGSILAGFIVAVTGYTIFGEVYGALKG